MPLYPNAALAAQYTNYAYAWVPHNHTIMRAVPQLVVSCHVFLCLLCIYILFFVPLQRKIDNILVLCQEIRKMPVG